MVKRLDARPLTLRLKEIEEALAPLVRLRGTARRAKRTHIRNKQRAAAKARCELAARAAAVHPGQKRGAVQLEGAAGGVRPAKRRAAAPGNSEPARPAPPAGSPEWLRATVEAVETASPVVKARWVAQLRPLGKGWPAARPRWVALPSGAWTGARAPRIGDTARYLAAAPGSDAAAAVAAWLEVPPSRAAWRRQNARRARVQASARGTSFVRSTPEGGR